MTSRGRRFGALAAGIVVLAGCRDVPTDTEINRLHAEAVAANEAAIAGAGTAGPTANEPGFTLTVSGQTATPSATLGWTELQKIGQTHVTTINVQNPDKKTPTDFRGVLVRDVLDRFKAAPEATEATVVAIDGFRATVQIADARTYRMLLALQADGAPIPKSSGGPIFLIHPFTESGPELRWRYPDRFWSFYVTHLIVGTEEPRVAIGGKVFDRAALDKIGDAVNVASRVESMTKDHGVQILITGEIVARLRDPSAFALRSVATNVAVRGRDEPIDLHTLDG